MDVNSFCKRFFPDTHEPNVQNKKILGHMVFPERRSQWKQAKKNQVSIGEDGKRLPQLSPVNTLDLLIRRQTQPTSNVTPSIHPT